MKNKYFVMFAIVASVIANIQPAHAKTKVVPTQNTFTNYSWGTVYTTFYSDGTSYHYIHYNN